MKKTLYTTLAAFLCFIFGAVFVNDTALCHAADATPTAAAKEVSKYLSDEGYLPRFDKDGDIVFKYEGLTHLILFNETDEEFFRILLPNVWSLDSLKEGEKAKAVLPSINRSVKVAKLVILDDMVHCEVDLFCADAKAFTKVLRRSLSAMRVSVKEFSAAME